MVFMFLAIIVVISGLFLGFVYYFRSQERKEKKKEGEDKKEQKRTLPIWSKRIIVVGIIVSIFFVSYFIYGKMEEEKEVERVSAENAALAVKAAEEAKEAAAQKALAEAQIEREAKEAKTDLQDYKKHLAIPEDELQERLREYVARKGNINLLDKHCQKLWQEYQISRAAAKKAAEEKFNESLRGEWNLSYEKPSGYSGRTKKRLFNFKIAVTETGNSLQMSRGSLVFTGEKTRDGHYEGTWTDGPDEGKFHSLAFSKNVATFTSVTAGGTEIPMKLYRQNI